MAANVSGSTAASAGTPSRVVFQMPFLQRLFSLVATIILGVASAFMTGLAVLLLFGKQWPLGLFVLAPCAFLLAALTGYTARDLRGKLGMRIALNPQSLTLDLPGGRSLIHRPPAQHLTIPYEDIEAIETRLEAYGSLGMEIMQHAYVLRRKNGDLIFLFEDRALATPLETPYFQRIAADIAARAGVAIRDIGTVEGKGGILTVWGTHAPDWAAPSLPMWQQMRIWRHVAMTGTLAIAAVIFAVAVRLVVFFAAG
jgi:hypothetical protein